MHTSWVLGRAWQILKDDDSISLADRKATILEFDKVLGLGLADVKKEVIPSDIQKLADERGVARASKNWTESDRIRDEINTLGWEILDTNNGQEIRKK